MLAEREEAAVAVKFLGLPLGTGGKSMGKLKIS